MAQIPPRSHEEDRFEEIVAKGERAVETNVPHFVFGLQTPQVPPALQCLQLLQFLQALHESVPEHVAASGPQHGSVVRAEARWML